MAQDRLIHWICISPAHRRRTALGLTRHGGGWAMCPELLGDGHEWADTGGVEIGDAIAQWQRTSDIDVRRPAAA